MRAALIGVLVGALTALSAMANPKDIQAVIDRQLSAFLEDDFAKAMEFASPVLKQYFGTPENFQRMVTQGYPMVWRPGTVDFLEHREEGGIHWQRVLIKDQQGRMHLLDYRMLMTADGWRINGVQILDAADFSA